MSNPCNILVLSSLLISASMPVISSVPFHTLIPSFLRYLIPLSNHLHLALKLDQFCIFLHQNPFINKVKKIKPNTSSCFISLFTLSSLSWILSVCKCFLWYPHQFLIHWCTSYPNFPTDLSSNLLCDIRSKRFLEDQVSCIQAFPQPVFPDFP